MDTSEENSDNVSLRDILNVVKNQGSTIISLQSQVSQGLNEIRQEVRGSTSQVQKLKSDTEFKWRFEGHRKQYNINSEVIEDLEQVSWAIDNAKLDYAKETLSSATEKLKKRNKLIKIADTSEGGWETVRQYENNPVASDSDDESKINRAESRAVKKRKASKQKKPYQRDNVKSYNSVFPRTGSYGSQDCFRPPEWFGFQQPFPAQPRFAATPGRRSGACYACGSFSH
ncbi:hypothetical protein FSP39_001110 [Pinctada imbricata]|uniref:Uncharacterized protein n=1 Tax=Pinctada imbricata TaxID=66713 RepID=A0AA88YU53_PINIB|nr:hypothetical protein FSP39_001110 [Pinctada imbricata]